MSSNEKLSVSKGLSIRLIFKSRKKILFFLFILLIFSGSLLIFNVIYLNGVSNVIADMNNAALGAILVAIITVFLLNEQSASEEIRERNSAVFNKKIIIYERFIEKIKSAANDDDISPQELNEIIFELAILGIHTKGTNVEEIWKSFEEIVELYRDKKEEIKQSALSDKLFKIVLIFQNELYGEDKGKPNLNELKRITDKIEKYTKTYYPEWDEYKEQLIQKGVNVEIIKIGKKLFDFAERILKETGLTIKFNYTPTCTSLEIIEMTGRNKRLTFVYFNKDNLKFSLRNPLDIAKVDKTEIPHRMVSDGTEFTISEDIEFNENLADLILESLNNIKKLNKKYIL